MAIIVIETKYLHTLIYCTYESSPRGNDREEYDNLMHENNTKHNNNINKRKGHVMRIGKKQGTNLVQQQKQNTFSPKKKKLYHHTTCHHTCNNFEDSEYGHMVDCK